MHIVYLSLGSNVGDRDANLRTAIASLTPAGVRVDRVSSIYETEPVDYQDQPWFLNCVLEAETDMQPQPLLQALRAIESQMGSKKEFAKGPRKIDLDILLYGSETIDTPELQIPHPRMLLRRFVLAPLAELVPTLEHPTWNATAAELLGQCSDKSVVRPFSPR
jgi:2-amino-4-hydroxy-6-hydroxymethyldihydropteridine diphosphokinase